MAVYWITFRLEDDARYRERYDNLQQAINDLSTKWWVDPSSFYLIESDLKIDQVAASLKNAVNVRTDIVLIGSPNTKHARLIGQTNDQDLFELMPFTKKV